MKLNLRFITLIFTLTLIFTVSMKNLGTNPVLAQFMRVYMNPEISTAEPGTEFTVELNIENSEKIYAWYARIGWNPEILNLTNLVEGSFLNQEGTKKTDFIQARNNTAGTAYFGCSLKGESPVAQPSGSGTLAYLTFFVLKEGETYINFTSFSLYNYWSMEPINPERYTLKGGYFKYPYFTVSVSPATIFNPNLTTNTTFNVNITAYVENLYGWNINLTWNKEILEMIHATEGPFLTRGDTYTSNFTYIIYSEQGYALLNSSLVEPAPPVNGTGTLVTITFKVKKLGESDITLGNVQLYTREGREIMHTLTHGKFSNILHDVAVISINAPIADNRLTIGDVINVAVDVKNKGNVPETIDVKLYYGLLVIDVQTITIEPNQTKTITFTWNTSDLTEGEDELKALIPPLPEESFTTDNEKIFGTIMVTKAAGIMFSREILIAIIFVIAIIIIAFFVLRRRKGGKG